MARTVGTVGADLSTRARHVIEHAIFGTGTAHRAEEIGRLTRRAARAGLRAAMHARKHKTLLEVLIVQPNCGAVTAREILDWIGLEDAVERAPDHTCVCRKCGRSLEHTLADAEMIKRLSEENAELKRRLKPGLRKA